MLNKEEYLDIVCREIRFSEVKNHLRRELAAHIDDKSDMLKNQGVENAEEEAVAAMGDAAETGRALNKAHKPRTEWGVIVCMLLLSLASLIITAIASAKNIAFISGWTPGNQIIVIVAGICIVRAAYYFDYSLILRLRYPFLAMAIILLAYNLLVSRYEVSQYFSLLSSAPSLSVILLLTSLFGFIGKGIKDGIRSIIHATGICCLSVAALVFSCCSNEVLIFAITYLVILAVVLHFSPLRGISRLIFLLISVLAITAVYGFSSQLNILIHGGSASSLFAGLNTLIVKNPNDPVVSAMLKGVQFIGPSPYYFESQFWTLQSSGRDYILTTIIAQFGWFAGIAVILTFSALIIIMFRRSSQVSHTFGKITAFGISSFFMIKFIIFFLSNTGIYGGLSCGLPFLSYGNSDYMSCSVLIGIYLSVWRKSSYLKDSNTYSVLNQRSIRPFQQI